MKITFYPEAKKYFSEYTSTKTTTTLGDGNIKLGQKKGVQTLISSSSSCRPVRIPRISYEPISTPTYIGIHKGLLIVAKYAEQLLQKLVIKG